MLRLMKSAPVLAALAGALVVLGTPTLARATYAAAVFDDGVPVVGTTIVSGNTLVFTASSADFSIDLVTGASNNPGTPQVASLAITNNTTIGFTSAGTHTLTIFVSQTGFTEPTTAALIGTSSAGGSYHGDTGDTVSATYQGVVDPTNTLFGNGAGVAMTPPPAPLAGQSTPLQSSGTITGTGLGITHPIVYAPGTSLKPFIPSAVPYSITDIATLTYTTGSANSQDNANIAATTALTPVPAPAGIVLALAGLPCLGGAWFWRRRKAA